MSLSPQWLDELRARITLSGVIGRTTRLTKAGREWKACCPFHNEKSPSFTVNDEKGFYHCFGCGAHGDAIRWMTDQRGLTFMDAVEELAAEAGMEMPAPDPRMAHVAEQRAGLHDVMSAAQQWFVEQLASDEGQRARAYLAKRGLDAHTIARFGFGYAPEGRQALKAGLQQFPEEMLIEGGLRIVVDDDKGNRREPYDRFRGRMMLPIHDARGRVIAFGGRILDSGKTDAPKYLNSPDTPLFDKGRTLYNLHRAGPVSRQSGRMLVVEGYMDVVALSAAGFGECVAPLGTALTETQIEMLWRMVEVPVLCFDGDAAGQRAAMRAVARALPLLRPAHSLAIVRLPKGLDPDDLLRQQGTGAMERVLSEARTLLDTLWEHEREALPLATPEDKAGLKARLMAHVETIADPDIKALYRRELLDRYAAFAFPRRDEPAAPWRPPSRPAGGQNGKAGRGRGAWQPLPSPRPLPETAAHAARGPTDALGAQLTERVIAGLCRWPATLPAHAEAMSRAAGQDTRLGRLLDHLESGGVLESGAITAILGPGVPDRAACPASVEQLAEVVAMLVERPVLEAALQAATARFDADPDGAFAEQQRLLKRKLEFDTRLRQMAEEPQSDAQDNPRD